MLSLLLLALSKSFEQFLLLLGRELLERFTCPLPEVFRLLLLSLGVVGTIGELAQAIGEPSRFARLFAFLLLLTTLLLLAWLSRLLAGLLTLLDLLAHLHHLIAGLLFEGLGSLLG